MADQAAQGRLESVFRGHGRLRVIASDHVAVLRTRRLGGAALVDVLRSSDPAWIGRYRLLGRLGSGGMGVVYLAEGPRGRVALKIVRPELGDDPAFRSRFRREIQASFRVLSERTVRLIDFDTEAEQPWMATEFVDGVSLDEEIGRRGPMSLVDQRSLAIGLAEALVAIHAENVVHRDLKPTNVIMSAFGPKVIDFGIAAAADAGRITSTGLVVGSSGWLAPERIETGDATAASDVFAFGLLLCFAACGEPPYGTGPSDVLLYRALHMAPTVPLDRLDPQLSDLVLAATSHEPANRPTALQLVALLASGRRISDVPGPGSSVGSPPPTEISTALPPAGSDPTATAQSVSVSSGAEFGLPSSAGDAPAPPASPGGQSGSPAAPLALTQHQLTPPPRQPSKVASSGAADQNRRPRWLLPAAAAGALALIGGVAAAIVGRSGSGHPTAAASAATSARSFPTATLTAPSSPITVRLTATKQAALAAAASVRDGDFPRALQPVNRSNLFLPCNLDAITVPRGSVLRGVRWAVDSPYNGNTLSETVAVMPTDAAGATVFNAARSEIDRCHTYEGTTKQQTDTVTITGGPKSIDLGDASVYVEQTFTPKNYQGSAQSDGTVIVQRGAVVVYLFLEYANQADLERSTALVKTLVQRIDAGT